MLDAVLEPTAKVRKNKSKVEILKTSPIFISQRFSNISSVTCKSEIFVIPSGTAGNSPGTEACAIPEQETSGSPWLHTLHLQEPALHLVCLIRVMPQENSLVRHTPSSGTRELFFSCTIHPGQGWPVGKYFGLGAVRFMPHTSQWSLSWQPLATNLCNTSGLKTQSSTEVGWLADRLNFAHLGYRVSIISVGFSQK